MGEEGIYCCAIYQFHQDSFRAAASRRVGLSAAHKASSLSVTRGRRPTRRPVAQALLLFIAAVLIDAGRRYWRERRAEIKLNARIDRSAPLSDDDAFSLLTELPNGGAT